MTEAEYLKAVGLEMKIARIRAGWTQDELAQKSNVNSRTISRLETGYECSFTTMIRLAKALGISLKEIV